MSESESDMLGSEKEESKLGSEKEFFSSFQHFLMKILLMHMTSVPGYVEHMRVHRLTRALPPPTRYGAVIGHKIGVEPHTNLCRCDNCPEYLKAFPLLVGFAHSFDKEHANTAFLHKYRGTVYAMAQGEDLLDREASFYSAVLTPIIFLQQYKDTWCLLERFHRALRLYQISHPTEKRSALKILQNLRSATQKVRGFILALQPAPAPATRTPRPGGGGGAADEDYDDTNDSRYFKELIRSLG